MYVHKDAEIHDVEDLHAVFDNAFEALIVDLNLDQSVADDVYDMRDSLISRVEDFVQREREHYHSVGEEEGYREGHDDGFSAGRGEAENDLIDITADVDGVLPLAVDYLNTGYLPATFDTRRLSEELGRLHNDTIVTLRDWSY